jgi:hypothetical protein
MVTTWNIAPNYDQWGWDEWWNCDDWITWHKQLKAHFGEERARLIWNYAYAQGTMGAGHWDCRTFNSGFRSYASKNNLDTYASIKVPILPQVLNLSGAAFDVVNGITETVSEIANTFGKTKVVKIAVYALLFGGVAYLGIRGYQAIKRNR